jgi:hypothetical protein
MMDIYAPGTVTGTGLLYIPVNYWFVLLALLFGLWIGVLVGRLTAFYELSKYKADDIATKAIENYKNAVFRAIDDKVKE